MERYPLGLSVALLVPFSFELLLRHTFRRPVHQQTAYRSLQGAP